MRGQPGHNTRYLYHVMAPHMNTMLTLHLWVHILIHVPCYGTPAEHYAKNASMGTSTFITCSAVILYADWLIDVRPGAVYTL